MWSYLFLYLNIFSIPPENKNNDNTKLIIFIIMVVIAIFQCLPYATVFVRCFLSTSSLNLTVSLWERFPCFTNEEMVVQGGYATLHSKILLASNQTWIWTNVFFLWRALHGFWDLWVRSYFGVIRNGMERRSYSWPWSLRFLWLFRLCSWNLFLRSRKQQRGRLHVCI